MAVGKWTAENITDQSGKIVVVTGANTGIGFATARALAEKNAEVILACRNAEKGNAAVERIKAKYPQARVKSMQLDLASRKSIRAFAEAYQQEYPQLQLLINNAGVMIPPYSKTEDGFELQFGVNHLGHFALTGLLLATENSRIVTVSSMAHKYGKLNFDDLSWEKRRYKAWRAYGDSKIANLYFTYELQRKLTAAGSKTIAAAAHPGWTDSDLSRHSSLFQLGGKLFAQSCAMGALPTLYAATVPNVKGGDYYGPSGFQEWRGYPQKVLSNKLSHDQSAAERLWSVSEELTGVRFEVGKAVQG